jgi:predicted metal-dependent hydrolase
MNIFAAKNKRIFTQLATEIAEIFEVNKKMLWDEPIDCPRFEIYLNPYDSRIAYSDSNNNVLGFNLAYLIYASKSEIRGVITHELAHIITDKLHPRSKHHGDEWQFIAKKMGIKSPQPTIQIKRLPLENEL